jgi:molecular chaperone DnaK (HSP70)
LKTDSNITLDINPFGLSIRTIDKPATEIFKRQTLIPTKTRQKFSTADDNPPNVVIEVLEGANLV